VSITSDLFHRRNVYVTSVETPAALAFHFETTA
jgi:hypothetical protein